VKEKEAPTETKSKAKGGRARKGSDSIDPHAQKFFAEGEAMEEGDGGRHTLHSESDPSALGIGVPPQRRGAFMRYVGIAVGLCAILCLAALARIALAHATKPAEPPVMAAPAAPAPLPEPVASAVPPPTPVPAASAAQVPAAEPSAEPDVPTKTALEEREDARRSLERGKLQDAIMAALRSTALDPTDGDAWLLLGAAYQEAGKSADARAAYGTCTKQATKGAVRECQLMLR
jgi:hypothetical protein